MVVPKRFRGALAATLLYILLHLSLHIFCWPHPVLLSDSPGYIAEAVSLAHDGELSGIAFRMPVYPSFLAIHLLIFGRERWLAAVTISQIILIGSGIGILMVLLGLAGVEPRSQAIFALCLSIYPATFFYESRVLTESLTFWFVCMYALNIWMVLRHEHRSGAFGLGIIAGGLALLRPEYVIFIPATGLLMFLQARRVRQGSGRVIAAYAVGSLPFVLGWMLRNLLVLGYFGFNFALGPALFSHVYDHVEIARTTANADLVDQLVSIRRNRDNSDIVWDAMYADANGHVRSSQEAIAYFHAIAGLSMRTILMRPRLYSTSVLEAGYKILQPAIGRAQTAELNRSRLSAILWQIYRFIHFLILGSSMLLVPRSLIRRDDRRRGTEKRRLLISSITALILVYSISNILLINGAQNRFRFPLDGLILVTTIVSYDQLRRERRIARPVAVPASKVPHQLAPRVLITSTKPLIPRTVRLSAHYF